MPRFAAPLDMHQNEVRNLRLQTLASAPSSPVVGQAYYDTTLTVARVWDGSAWQDLELLAADATVTVTSAGVKVAKTLDHTYVTDFDTQVRTSRLEQMAAPTADVSLNGHKATNLANGSADTDAATVGQMNALVQGLQPKGAAAAA